MAPERIDTPPQPRRDGLSATNPVQRSAPSAGKTVDSSKPQPATMTAEQRAARIAEAAYAKAQQRGFAPGYEWDDWFTAEREIDAEIQALMSRSSLPGS